MGFRKRIIKLQRKVLQAAALGSTKLLRTILHSHARPLRKEQKKSRKRGREDDSKSRRYNRQKKRARKAEQREIRRRGNVRKRKDEEEEGFNSDTESEDSALRADVGTGHSKRARHREQKECVRGGSSRKRKEAEEGDTSDEEIEESDIREGLGFTHSKRARREEQTETTSSAKHEGPSSEYGQTNKNDYSSPRGSSGKEFYDGSRTESDIEEISPRRAGSKHPTSEETVRNIVNCRDAEGLSPLHHACHAGSEDLVRYLISKGASVHARDSKGNTPLHIAAKLGPASIVTILKDADADTEAFNDQGVTPSDILGEKEAAARRREMLKDHQKWHSHVAEELSDNDDTWWGTEWGEDEQPDWEDPILERMAESRQGGGLYNEPFSLRDFLKAEKNKTQNEQGRKSNRKGSRNGRPSKNDERKSPDVVLGPTLNVPVQVTQSYSQRWKTFSESYNLCLSYSSVPFPVEEGQEDTLREVLLQGISPSMQRTALRKEMLKWHPDKFLQKWGAKLQGPDHDRIVARVNGVSEAIHKLYKNLTPLK